MEPVLVVQFGCVKLRTGIAGFLFTVTRTVAVFEHPLAPCPVTMYVEDTVGLIGDPFSTEPFQV